MTYEANISPQDIIVHGLFYDRKFLINLYFNLVPAGNSIVKFQPPFTVLSS